MDEASSTWQLMAAAGFVIINAFFVASEFAMAKVKPGKLRELAGSGNRRAETALRITERLGVVTSATQSAIAITSIAAGVITVPALARLLAIPLTSLGVNLSLTRVLSVLASFLIVGSLHTVLGVLVPRAISIQKAEAVALWCAVPLNAFLMIFTPLSWLLHRSADGLLGMLGLRPISESCKASDNEEDVRMIVSSSQEEVILEDHQAELVETSWITLTG